MVGLQCLSWIAFEVPECVWQYRLSQHGVLETTLVFRIQLEFVIADLLHVRLDFLTLDGLLNLSNLQLLNSKMEVLIAVYINNSQYLLSAT